MAVTLEKWLQGSRVSIKAHRLLYHQRRADMQAVIQRTATEPIQPYLSEYLPVGKTEIRILDIGSGPISFINHNLNGSKIVVEPIDALGDNYRRMLEQLKLKPAVYPRPIYAEQLLDYYPADSFDLVYTCNALDHTLDPLRVIANALTVLKPDRCLFISTLENEGDRERGGLHNWNLFTDGISLFLRSKGDDEIVNVTETIKEQAAGVKIQYDLARKKRRVFHAVFRKNPPTFKEVNHA